MHTYILSSISYDLIDICTENSYFELLEYNHKIDYYVIIQ